MEGRRREGEQWRGGGERWRGEWCEVKSEEQELTHHRLRPLMGAGRRCLVVHLRSHAVDSWAFVSFRPGSFPFTGVRFCWWAVVVRAQLASLVVIRVQSGGAVGSSWRFVM